MGRRAAGAALLAMGAILMAVGAAGFVLGGDEPGGLQAIPVTTVASTTTAAAEPAVTSTTEAPTPPSAEPPGTAPTDPPPARAESGGEEPADFVARLAAAIRARDVDFLTARLHPAVVDLYGNEACRATLQRLADPTIELEPRSVRGPAPYQWEIDGRSTAIEAAYTVAVVRSQQGRSVEAEVHVAPAGGLLRWFTDCGEPRA